jgi:hypothetical protein
LHQGTIKRLINQLLYTDREKSIRFDPVFTQIYIDSQKVKVISLWEAICLVGKIPESAPPANEESNVYTVQELSQKAKKGGWGPIVVFAEVNKSILQWFFFLWNIDPWI